MSLSYDALHDMDDALPVQYGSLEELPTVRREHVEALEAWSTTRLLNLIRDYAPHLAVSFVISTGWWKSHERMPEAHVSGPTPLYPYVHANARCRCLSTFS